ncbi:MAG: winged helix-turn-helix domain-containing protein [Methanosarcinaceae archaeon]|nr:winged helix-turn-helix domain-containing protein [Methanosarcinaceae archaeon]
MDEVCLSIGEAAGQAYRLLEKGECNLASIKKDFKESGLESQMVFLALGWLAREDKISLQKNGNTWIIGLK